MLERVHGSMCLHEHTTNAQMNDVDVILSQHSAFVEGAPHAPSTVGRWSARNSRFRLQDGWAAAFLVYCNSLRALDSCNVEGTGATMSRSHHTV